MMRTWRCTLCGAIGHSLDAQQALIAATLGHDSPTVRRLAKRAHDTSVRLGLLVDEIRAAVDAHAAAQAEDAKRAARIKKLEDELARLKASSAKHTAAQTCECGWTGQKLAQHRAMAHKGES